MLQSSHGTKPPPWKRHFQACVSLSSLITIFSGSIHNLIRCVDSLLFLNFSRILYGINSLIETLIFDGTQEVWQCLRVPLSRFLLNKRPDSFDVRVSQWAGTVRGHALSQTQTAAAGTPALIGKVQDLFFCSSVRAEKSTSRRSRSYSNRSFAFPPFQGRDRNRCQDPSGSLRSQESRLTPPLQSRLKSWWSPAMPPFLQGAAALVFLARAAWTRLIPVKTAL